MSKQHSPTASSGTTVRIALGALTFALLLVSGVVGGLLTGGSPAPALASAPAAAAVPAIAAPAQPPPAPMASPRTTTRPTTSIPKSTTARPTTKSPTTSSAAAKVQNVPAKQPSSDTDVSYRCTNRIDYGSDPRDNATINSIGAQTGRCPAPIQG